MNFDQYRLQPLPPRKKPIWKILAFGVIAILLISAITFTLLNQRYMCELIGGMWIPYPLSEAYKRDPNTHYDPTEDDLKRMDPIRGACFDMDWWRNR